MAKDSRSGPKAIAAFAAAALCGGCSLLFDVDADQCSTTADCAARGEAFAGLVCVAGACVSPGVEAGSSATSSAMESGVEASAEASVASDGEAGIDGGATTAEAGSDAGVVQPCTTWTDCTPASTTHVEVACDPDSHTCIQLTTDECPYVLPADIYMAPQGQAPIFIGAFATFPANAPFSDPTYLNYQLALNEFQTAGGVNAGSGGSRWPAAVVCDDSADPNVIMTHLVNDVHVPAVIAALPSATLKTTFSNVDLTNVPNAPTVFFINPFGADGTLTSLNTQGMLWHMLGQSSDTAPAYAALFPIVEAYVRNNPNNISWWKSPLWIPSAASIKDAGADAGADGAADAGPVPIRVLGVIAHATVTDQLEAAVESVLTFNGESVAANTADGNYQVCVIPASSLNGADPTTVDVSSCVGAMMTFQPNVVISYASEEFSTMFETYEVQAIAPWHPFYLLGPYNSESATVLTWLGLNQGVSSDRFAGITFASTNDPEALGVFNTYQTDFLAAGNPSTALGGENYYDSMYFAVYSLAGAGREAHPTGIDLVPGMTHLVDLSGTRLDMGPADIGAVEAQIALTNQPISLIGTLGPPEFNLTTGARISQGDVYCAQFTPPPSPNSGYAWVRDVLRLADDGGSPDDAGVALDGAAGTVGTLQGSFPCFGGM
jgi:hypothetical protein